MWRVYRAFLQSEDTSVIATSLAITPEILAERLARDPEFREAAEAAQADRLPACFQDMDDSAKAIWTVLSGKDSPEDAKQQAMLALAHGGRREQQKLLAWALMNNNFDVNGAIRHLGISQGNYRKWLKDAEFAELIASVQFAKRNFVEGRLMALVAVGDVKATIFATERLLREEYGQKLEVSGTVDHQHTANLDLSRLPMDLRIQVMEALQASGCTDPDGLLIDSSEFKRLN